MTLRIDANKADSPVNVYLSLCVWILSEHTELSHYVSPWHIHHAEPLPSFPFLTQWLSRLPLRSVRYKQTVTKCCSYSPQRHTSSHHLIPLLSLHPFPSLFFLLCSFISHFLHPFLLLHFSVSHFSILFDFFFSFGLSASLWEVNALNHLRDAHCLWP